MKFISYITRIALLLGLLSAPALAQVSSSYIPPNIFGAATGTSLALGGATIGGNSLAVTGPAQFNGGTAFYGTATFVNGAIAANPSNTTGMQFDNYNTGFVLGSAAPIGFSATNAMAAADSNFSRISAGVIGVGTGLQGSVAGTISAATHRIPPAATFPASPSAGDIASVNTATSPTIGSIVTLGGSAFALGVYNGTQWTCIGK